MPNIEKQVCTLETAKRMAELGFRNKSMFKWVKYDIRNDFVVWYDPDIKGATMETMGGVIEEQYRAYTAGEAGIFLQARYQPFSSSFASSSVPIFTEGEYCWYQNGEIIISAETEAEARCLMLIYLAEKKIIDPKNI
jgi:hypothetical protein